MYISLQLYHCNYHETSWLKCKSSNIQKCITLQINITDILQLYISSTNNISISHIVFISIYNVR